MIKSINDIYREKIANLKTIDKVIDYLKGENVTMQQYVSNLMLSDLHKIKIFKILTTSTFDELEIMKKKGLKYSIDFSDPNKVFNDCVEATIEFTNMDLVTKISLFELLDIESIDNILYNANPLHVLDKSIYKFAFELDEFVNYYYDYITKNPNDDYFVIDYLADKMELLKEINYEKYKIFILEFLRGFYKNSIYDGVECNKRYQDYINKINNLPIKLLFNEAEEDIVFLTSILEEYLKYSVSEEKEQIDKNFYSSTEKGIQKKLKLI